MRNGAFRRKLKRRMKITYVDNSHGPRLGLTSAGLIEQDGAYFKDLEGTGQLLPYEDWRLTPEERAIIQTHPSVGGQVLKNFTALSDIDDGARYHHERYDG